VEGNVFDRHCGTLNSDPYLCNSVASIRQHALRLLSMKNVSHRKTVAALFLLFFVLTIIYHSNLRLLAAGDSLPTSLLTLSLLIDRSVTLDRFGDWLWHNLPYTHGIVIKRDGHYYSIYPITQSALVAPLLAPVVFALGASDWEISRQVYFVRMCEKIVAVLLASVTAVMMFLTVQQLVSWRWAWTLTLVFALGTSTWTIGSQALWQHTTGQVWLVAALYFFVRWMRTQRRCFLWWCGACAGVALLIRPTNALMVFALATPLLISWRNVRNIIAFLAAPILGVVGLCAFNLHIYGTALGGYGHFLRAPAQPLTALAGILFSPGRGLFIFSPALLFSIYSLISPSSWKPPVRNLTIVCLLFATGHIAVVSQWPFWWGGHSWGARLLTEVVPVLIILIAVAVPAFAQSKMLTWAFYGLGVFSVYVHAIGAYCYPRGEWDSRPVSIDAEPSRVWNWADNPIIRTAQGGLDYQPYRNAYKLLRSESWTLSGQRWKALAPGELAVAMWWSVPDPIKFTPLFPEAIGSRPRYASGACFVDIVRTDVDGDNSGGDASWLNVTGWAFDASSGSVPEKVIVELFSIEKGAVFAPGERYDRPDVARAFSNPSFGRAGFVVSANVADVPAAQYQIRILQIVKNTTVAECNPSVRVTIN
jgi:hypothetical protein